MTTVIKLRLTPKKRAELEEGASQDRLEKYRLRCQIVLLKAVDLTNKEIAEGIVCDPVTVSNWVKRYQIEGIDGLAEYGWRFDKEEEEPQSKQLHRVNKDPQERTTGSQSRVA